MVSFVSPGGFKVLRSWEPSAHAHVHAQTLMSICISLSIPISCPFELVHSRESFCKQSCKTRSHAVPWYAMLHLFGHIEGIPADLPLSFFFEPMSIIWTAPTMPMSIPCLPVLCHGRQRGRGGGFRPEQHVKLIQSTHLVHPIWCNLWVGVQHLRGFGALWQQGVLWHAR